MKVARNMLGVRDDGRRVEARARGLLVCSRLDAPTQSSLARNGPLPAIPVDSAAAVWRIPRVWNCRGTVLRGTEHLSAAPGGNPNLMSCAINSVPNMLGSRVQSDKLPIHRSSALKLSPADTFRFGPLG
jgi:hypothetical protein